MLDSTLVILRHSPILPPRMLERPRIRLQGPTLQNAGSLLNSPWRSNNCRRSPKCAAPRSAFEAPRSRVRSPSRAAAARSRAPSRVGEWVRNGKQKSCYSYSSTRVVAQREGGGKNRAKLAINRCGHRGAQERKTRDRGRRNSAAKGAYQEQGEF